MISIDQWLYSVLLLFDHILRALLRQSFFSVLLYVLLALLGFGIFAVMIRVGKRV